MRCACLQGPLKHSPSLVTLPEGVKLNLGTAPWYKRTLRHAAFTVGNNNVRNKI